MGVEILLAALKLRSSIGAFIGDHDIIDTMAIVTVRYNHYTVEMIVSSEHFAYYQARHKDSLRIWFNQVELLVEVGRLALMQ